MLILQQNVNRDIHTHSINNGIKTFLPKQTIPMAVRYARDNLQSWTKKKERNQANMIN